MKCPRCGSVNNYVIDTRESDDQIRRRRSCGDCGNRFTSYEITQERMQQINGELGKYRLIGEIIHDLFNGGQQ